MARFSLTQIEEKMDFILKSFPLSIYKGGSLMKESQSLEDWRLSLIAAKRIEASPDFIDKEFLFQRGLSLLLSDIRNILHELHIDLNALEIDSIFFTSQIQCGLNNFNLFHIFKWKVLTIKSYSDSYLGDRLIYEVTPLPYQDLIIENDSTYVFTSEEILLKGFDSEVKALEEQAIFESKDPEHIKLNKEILS